MKKFAYLSLILCSQSLLASNESINDTEILWVRSHTLVHPSAAGLVTFKVAGVLKGECNELVIKSEDKTSFSHVLSAQAQRSKVDFAYKTDGFTHWGGGCWLLAITVK